MNILCIGAHPDDVDIGMGGTILSLIDQGHKVSILDLTDGEPTPKGTHEKRMAESAASSAILGITERITLDLENRWLEDSKEARKKVAAVIRRIRPEILFIPYWLDAHPDHITGSFLSVASAFTAKLTRTDIEGEPFQPKKIFSYFSSHLRLVIKPSFIMDISKFMDKKLEALTCYKSQFAEQDREEFLKDMIRSNAHHWGTLIKREYGEAFACREEIGLSGIEDLVI